MSDNPKHVTVRLRVPPELRDKIAESSEQYNRSMNADMVARLEDSFKDDLSKYENVLREAKLELLLKELTVRFGVFNITVSTTEDDHLQRQKDIEELKNKKK
ncbi:MULTISPECIES: Arc family DNA-binding protein [Acinetobacter]|uniref:Arc family DNA-binding protein n=2 Tax=Acinetobacter TaxID=469 RepID=A0A4Q7APZ1_9GAMM|nr:MULTISPECIES: Arc family DNA-binding protein [Acinetobacter]MCW8041135.1 Arc family DNA-binding protein [Acinetobacter entericus]RZG64081.1 Arc family DNA-binding protein [Acinetobacter bouvetii]